MLTSLYSDGYPQASVAIIGVMQNDGYAANLAPVHPPVSLRYALRDPARRVLVYPKSVEIANWVEPGKKETNLIW
jgi:hypothetical protein